MKRNFLLTAILWSSSLLLGADLLYLGYFFVFRAAHYFPGAYEDAFQAAEFGVPIGIVLSAALIIVIQLRRLGQPSAAS